MDFDKWSFEKRKTFLKSLRHLDDDRLYNMFKKEGFEVFKAGDGSDFYGITPQGVYYYFCVKPEKAKLTDNQKKKKQEYRHRYVLIVRD